MSAVLTADEVIAHLELKPHPEGGYSARRFRDEGDHPHAAVPAHVWRSAHSLGPWTLLGRTVAPGFDFSGFEMAPEGFEP